MERVLESHGQCESFELSIIRIGLETKKVTSRERNANLIPCVETAGLGVEAAGEGKRYKLSYDQPADEVDEVEEEEAVVLEFPDPGPFDRAIVRCAQATFARAPRPLIIPLGFENG